MAKKYVAFYEDYDVIDPLDYQVFDSLADANRNASFWAEDLLNMLHHEGRVWVASCEEKDLHKYLELLKNDEIDPVMQDDFYAEHFDSNRHFFDSDDDFCQRYCLAKDATDQLTSILIKHEFVPLHSVNDKIFTVDRDVTNLKSIIKDCTFSLGEGSLGLLLDDPLETAVKRATVVGVENEFLRSYLEDVRPSFDEERKWFNKENSDDKWYFSLEELKESMAGEVDFDLLDPAKVSNQTVAEYIANLELDHGIRINANFDPNSDNYEEYFYIDHSNPDYLTICSAPYNTVFKEVSRYSFEYNKMLFDTLKYSPEELGVDPNSKEYKHFSELADLSIVRIDFTSNFVLDAKDWSDYRDLDELYNDHDYDNHDITRYDKLVKPIMEGIKAEYKKELVQEGLLDVNQQEQKVTAKQGRGR